MNTGNMNSEFPERNMTKIFITVSIAIIIVLLAVVIIMLGIKMDSGDNIPQAGSYVDGSDAIEATGTPGGSAPADIVTAVPELKIISTEEQAESVIISTSYCTLSYPSMFSDMIKVESYFGEGMGCIMFLAEFNGKSATAYTVLFNSENGIDVGTLKVDGTDQPLRVSVSFYEPTEDMTGDDLTSFYAVAETFNDIAQSLEKNEGFTSAN